MIEERGLGLGLERRRGRGEGVGRRETKEIVSVGSTGYISHSEMVPKTRRIATCQNGRRKPLKHALSHSLSTSPLSTPSPLPLSPPPVAV